ncbi:MAG: sigma-70 family RNA polymerase sigma factor, partial [Acidimicrobiales bacterium]
MRTDCPDVDLVRLYLDSIGQYPLLTRQDEVRLSRLICNGRSARRELAKGKTTGARKRQLLQMARQGDRAAEQFINSNLRLVVSIAKRYQSSDLALLDLVQEGNLGLVHAVEKFDWRKGFKFSTYATWWIKQAIGRGIDNAGRTIRLPIHAGDQVRRLLRAKGQLENRLGHSPSVRDLALELAMPEEDVNRLLMNASDPVSLDAPLGPESDADLGDIIADLSSPSPFEVVAGQMMSSEVEKLLAPLEDREREILRLRYGLGSGEPCTLDEVGT